MTETTTAQDGFSILGLGAAACVACCAGPILAFVGGLSIARPVTPRPSPPRTKEHPVNPIPIYDATAPIACTASSEEIPVRVEQVERMRTYLDRLERTPHGLLLHFPNRPDIDAELRTFAVDEKRCCSFWGFAIDTQDDQLTLRWDGPPDVEDFFAQLVRFFEGDEPLTDISGLL